MTYSRSVSSVITLACLCAALSVCLLPAEPVWAKVTRIEIDVTEHHGVFRTGEYLRIEGKFTGEIETTESIPDLKLADPDGEGKVQYSTRFALLVPKNLHHSNGTLLFDVENRGRPVAHFLYDSPRDFPPAGVPGLAADFEHVYRGIGFLEDAGFMIANAQWELGQGVELPTFTDEIGKTRYLEGIGFAVVRDLVAFLKYENEDASGAPNPLANAVKRTIGVGYSQTSRFLKTALLLGFNSLDGKRVFDGLHLQAPYAGLLPLMQSGLGPKSSVSAYPNFNGPELRGVYEPPFTYREIIAIAHARGEDLPKLIVTNMATDYYSLRASLARTGLEGTEEAPIPDNVLIWDVAGAGHVYIPNQDGCDWQRSQLDSHPVMRATLHHLNRWLTDGTLPPESQLMPLERPNGDLAVRPVPPSAPAATIQVPKVDADGNHLGGIRLPELQVPSGTHLGQNGPLTNVYCTLSGGYAPFAQNKAERDSAKDSRPSIAERYPNLNDYVARISKAAHDLEEAGYILSQDADTIIHAAAQSTAFR